jgi:hypothetical protein
MLVTGGFAVLALVMLRRNVPPPRVFAWTVAAFVVCIGNTGIRAQSFAYALFALTLWLVLGDGLASRPRARTWLVVPVLMLWANTHGTVLLGAGLVSLYAGYRTVRSFVRNDPGAAFAYLALGATAGAALLCTPYGTGIIRYYARFTGNSVFSQYIVEWARPTLTDQLSWGFFAVALAAATAVTVGWRRGTRPDPLLTGLALVLLTLALTAIRFQAWFGFAGSLLAADTLAWPGGGQVPVLGQAFRRAIAGALGALALASLAVLAVIPASQSEILIPRRAIDVAAAIAARNPGARILGDDWSGTPLLWLHPAMSGRVGFDVRVEQYTPAELSAYSDFLLGRGPNWQRVMRGYDIIVVSRSRHAVLAGALAGLPGWRVVYSDHDGLVAERQAGT